MKKYFSSFSVIVLSVFFIVQTASAFTGTINSSFKQSLVCQDAGCTTAAAGILNWKPTLTTGITAVTVDDATGLNGNVWGNSLGWINLKPTSQGVSVNSTSGAMSGYAYSPVCGYINFSPTGYGVSIVTETQQTNGSGGVGQFYGYAWCGGQSGGWIKFDCATAGNAACVKTDWVKLSDRITTTPPSTGGGGGGGGSTVSNSNPVTTPVDQVFQTQSGPQNQKVDYTNEYRADINDSGIVDILDYNSLMVNWAKQNPDLNKSLSKQDRCKSVNLNIADVNCDGNVDVLDFNIVMIYWGKLIGPQVKK